MAVCYGIIHERRWAHETLTFRHAGFLGLLFVTEMKRTHTHKNVYEKLAVTLTMASMCRHYLTFCEVVIYSDYNTAVH